MNSWIREEINNIRLSGLLRRTVPIAPGEPGKVIVGGKTLVDFASNDYLGLSTRKELKGASIKAVEEWGCSSRASRLMSGSMALFDLLEKRIAEFQGTEDAICLGNGYLANSTIIPSLVGPGDVIFLDRYCHASIIDGVMLSRAHFFRFSHNDATHLERLLKEKRVKYRRALILVESLYSMDGDIAPLNLIMELKARYDALLMVDEAHAIGVFGSRAEGLIPRHLQNKPEVMIGTFGKALGSYGAFAACTKEMKTFLLNRCRGFIFSTALPPGVIAANLKAIEMVAESEEDRNKVLMLATQLRSFIKDRLKKKTLGESHIVPLILDDIKQTVELERYLVENGIFVRSIRPPTVPKNEPRIRFSVTANHTKSVIEKVNSLLKVFFSSS